MLNRRTYPRRSRIATALRFLASALAALDCLATAWLDIAPLHQTARRLGRVLRTEWRRLRWKAITDRPALESPVLTGRIIVRPTTPKEEK